MKGLISAIQFITIFRIGKPAHFVPMRMLPFFPIVGILLGLLIAVFDWLALIVFPNPVVSFLDILFFIILTGALHLDGLGDTADGLLGHHPREKALAIMKDSRIGAMGLVAVVCAIIIKWCGVMTLDAHRFLFMVMIPALSRGSMLFGIRFLTYGRAAAGTGHPFFQEKLKTAAFIGLAAPIILAFFTGLKGLLLLLFFCMLTGAILLFYQRRLGCITGDMLGAMSETIESSLFVLATIQI